MDYSKMLKAELEAELEKRGLKVTGLKDELIARLEADDLSKAEETPKKAKVQAKRKVWNPMLFRYEIK